MERIEPNDMVMVVDSCCEFSRGCLVGWITTVKDVRKTELGVVLWCGNRQTALELSTDLALVPLPIQGVEDKWHPCVWLKKLRPKPESEMDRLTKITNDLRNAGLNVEIL